MIKDLSSNSKGSPWWRCWKVFRSEPWSMKPQTPCFRSGGRSTPFTTMSPSTTRKFLEAVFFSGHHPLHQGMEFAHVVILDGDWGAPSGDKQAERRRTVVRRNDTRRETLTLMRSEEGRGPFFKRTERCSLLCGKLRPCRAYRERMCLAIRGPWVKHV